MFVLSGVRLTSADMSHGSIPFIGATDSNNGITNWTDISNTSTDQNVLGINYNGSVGEVFYHPYKATFSDDIKRLKLKLSHTINKETYLFIKTTLLQQKSKYTYGYKFNGKRMKAQKIILPILNDGTPNWEYMEQYIVNIMNPIEIPEVEPFKSSNMDLKSVQWKEFEIKQVFDKISSVKGKTISNYLSGKVPYVTTSATNNGLTNYISPDKEIITSGNVITIDPIKGKAFYHIYDFVGRGGAGSAINVLKSKHLNKNIGLFLTTMIESNSFLKASYGTQLNGKRLKKQKVMLPITDNGTPNWKFMEDYIKSISNSHLI
ncbi:hypothetical protein IGK38_002212 [Enterococcus pernyi]